MLTQTEFAIIVLGFLLVIQLAILIVGKIFGKLAMLVSISNILVGVSIISYWMLNQLYAPTHFIELREVAVVCSAVLVIAAACYSMVLPHNNKFFRVTPCVSFAIYLLCSILFLIFMLTLQINRLF